MAVDDLVSPWGRDVKAVLVAVCYATKSVIAVAVGKGAEEAWVVERKAAWLGDLEHGRARYRCDQGPDVCTLWEGV